MGLVAKRTERHHVVQTQGHVENPRPPYATGVVHHDTVLDDGTVVHHHQRFDSGLLVDWQRDDEPGPWALVRHGDPFAAFEDVVADRERIDAVSVRIGSELFALPPADDLEAPGWDALPLVPDATARLRFVLWGSPVGTVALDIRYLDGRRTGTVVQEWPDTAEGEPAHGAPEMDVAMTWRNYLRMRSGEATALEAIEEGGNVDARWTLLLLLHGLVQEPEYEAIYRALPRMPEELAWWGEVAPFIPARESF